MAASPCIEDKEVRLIIELRKRVSDLDLDPSLTADKHLIRWLRARDLDVKNAEQMLRRSILWNQQRKQEQLGESSAHHHEEAISRIRADFPVSVPGTDSAGHPIVVIPSGAYDFKRAADSELVSQVSEHFYSTFDQLLNIVIQKSVHNDHELMRAVGIVDFAGLGWSQCTSLGALQLIISLVRNFEANYPEVVEAAFVVNAPAIFSIIYRVLSPIFAPRTLAKFKFFGCNTAEWQAELRKIIPGDQLPVKYGGSQSTPVNWLKKENADQKL